jgi:hypothetical protein
MPAGECGLQVDIYLYLYWETGEVTSHGGWCLGRHSSTNRNRTLERDVRVTLTLLVADATSLYSKCLATSGVARRWEAKLRVQMITALGASSEADKNSSRGQRPSLIKPVCGISLVAGRSCPHFKRALTELSFHWHSALFPFSCIFTSRLPVKNDGNI